MDSLLSAKAPPLPKATSSAYSVDRGKSFEGTGQRAVLSEITDINALSFAIIKNAFLSGLSTIISI